MGNGLQRSLETRFGQSSYYEQFPLWNYAIKKEAFQILQIHQRNGQIDDNKVSIGFDEVTIFYNVSSISSLEAKLIFIKDRMKLPINEQTLELLQYKFAAIRPRGELLVRAKETITLENIIDFIKMSDEEFAKKLDIPVSRVKEEN